MNIWMKLFLEKQMNKLRLYHGSEFIINNPVFDKIEILQQTLDNM